MKKAVLGCAGLLLCLGLLAGCDTTLVGPGLAYHDPGDTVEEKTEPGVVIPDGDIPEGDDPDGDDNGGTGDNNPNNPDNPDTGNGGGSGDGGSGDGDGSGDGEPEVSSPYTLAVTTSTIINNFKREDGSDFALGSGDTPATSCQLEGYTFEFDGVFSIAFTKEDGGGEAGARLWDDGIRVYINDDFTIKPLGEWSLSKIVLTYKMSDTTNLSLVVKNGEEIIATEAGTTTSYTLENASIYSEITAGPTRASGNGGHAKFSSIEVTCTK